MREFKFKAWDTKEKVMIDDWIAFVYENSIIPGMGNLWDDPRFIKLQFTGQTDKYGKKYGKEIYGGDILEIEGEYYEVIYGNGRFSLAGFNGCECSLLYRQVHQNKIGNIHENPELLEKPDA